MIDLIETKPTDDAHSPKKKRDIVEESAERHRRFRPAMSAPAVL
jgi:hypothetical protein